MPCQLVLVGPGLDDRVDLLEGRRPLDLERQVDERTGGNGYANRVTM